jgi:hypothetical protein
MKHVYRTWLFFLIGTALIPTLSFETVSLPQGHYYPALWQQHTGKVLWALVLVVALHVGWQDRRGRQRHPAVWAAVLPGAWLLLYAAHKLAGYWPLRATNGYSATPGPGWTFMVLAGIGWVALAWAAFRHRQARQ